MNDERTLRPDFWAVALDITSHMVDGWKYAQYVKKVETVYFYDRNEQTCCCEITPSHCLYAVNSRAILNDDVDCHSELADEIDWEINSEADEDIYIHCSRAESILSGKTPHRHLGDYFPDVSLDEYEEMVESMREYLQGNEVL